MADEVSAADAALKEALQPVIELDSQLALKEAHVMNELDEIRSERRKLAGVLRQLDPERAPGKPGPKSNKGTDLGRIAPYAIAEHCVEEVRQIVVGFGEKEFSSADVFKLWETSGSEAAVKDKITKSFGRLRERGQIRLISNTRGKHGGFRYLATPRIESPVTEVSTNGRV